MHNAEFIRARREKKAKVMKARDDWGLDLQTHFLLFIYFNSTGVVPVSYGCVIDEKSKQTNESLI